MDASKKEQVALFRFGLIFPLLDDRLKHGDITRLANQICEREHDIPFSGKKTVSMPTIYNWLNAYRRNRNIEDLYPKDRSDKGCSRRISRQEHGADLTESE